MVVASIERPRLPHRISIDIDEKRVILIRHGCTHMNEYLSKPGSRWGEPTFADDWSLRDSPLSNRGISQARQLYHFCEDQNLLHEIDLVVVSPLTRALQTLEIGVLPLFKNRLKEKNLPLPKIIALPFASERVYMSSEIGSSVGELQKQFPFVDFEIGFSKTLHPSNEWWWTPSPGTVTEEWRPFGQGQVYINVGEPEQAFQVRMRQLYDWLANRQEKNIVLICHWAVLQFLCGHDFQNCEVKELTFDQLSRSGFSLTAEEEEAIFSIGERDMQ
jgi:broad specificity phosphatase PhoE